MKSKLLKDILSSKIILDTNFIPILPGDLCIIHNIDFIKEINIYLTEYAYLNNKLSLLLYNPTNCYKCIKYIYSNKYIIYSLHINNNKELIKYITLFYNLFAHLTIRTDTIKKHQFINWFNHIYKGIQIRKQWKDFPVVESKNASLNNIYINDNTSYIKLIYPNKNHEEYIWKAYNKK